MLFINTIRASKKRVVCLRDYLSENTASDLNPAAG